MQQVLRQTDRPTRHLRLDEIDADGYAFPETEATIRLLRKPDTEWLVDAWSQARRDADANPRGLVLALDEIQTLPGWSSTVKGLWDADRAQGREMHVIILGSAPLLIQSGLTESLAGRFEPIHVGHWSFNEMADAFNFDLAECIYYGGYPGGARFIRVAQLHPRCPRPTHIEATVEPNAHPRVNALRRPANSGSSSKPH